MEGGQERDEPLDRAQDLSSLNGEVEAVARGDRSMQQCRGESTACWPVLPLQLRSDAVSIQCAPVGPRTARWKDRENDRTAPWTVGTTTRRVAGKK